jgi:hypothetical protein
VTDLPPDDPADDVPPVTRPAYPAPGTPPSSWRYRAFVAAALAVAAGALYLGVRATETESDDPITVNGRPEVVEHLHPRNGAEVLRQVEVGIDLVSGYEAALMVNDTTIPVDELRQVPEQNQVFFTPGEGKVLERLPAGQTCVTATVWRSADGRGVDDLSYRWCFDVT